MIGDAVDGGHVHEARHEDRLGDLCLGRAGLLGELGPHEGAGTRLQRCRYADTHEQLVLGRHGLELWVLHHGRLVIEVALGPSGVTAVKTFIAFAIMPPSISVPSGLE
jgi:hypothetical protein